MFDPVHAYGLPEYLRILDMLDHSGWPRSACQPHGGHLFCLHIVATLGLGGCESNAHNFQPFGGFSDQSVVRDGAVRLPDAPGIGFETRGALWALFESLVN
jgi:L-alanine-DL-glutamate epimerase-like enolase superfamily enzyme